MSFRLCLQYLLNFIVLSIKNVAPPYAVAGLPSNITPTWLGISALSLSLHQLFLGLTSSFLFVLSCKNLKR